MKKQWTVLLGVALLVAPAGWAQQTQDFPSAPTPVQPHFPGAPAQPAQKQTQEAGQVTGSGAATLSTLPPVQPPTAAQSEGQSATPAQQSGTDQQQKSSSEANAASPQTANPQSEADTGMFRIGVDVDLVDLIFTATDKHGRFIRDLKQGDIKLLDEGKPPLRIEAFESETGLPLRVGLLIDASNSIRDRFRFEQAAAIEFLHQMVRPKSDRAFVIGFDSLSDLTQDFTDNTDALARGVSVLRPGGGTALHDAVYQACEKLAKAPVNGPVRRAIILLSDGDDNQSRHTREEAIEAALRAEVIIYVISTNISDADKKGDKVLMRYAEATGGQVFFPLRLEDVSNAFSDIQNELRSQYVIAYKPENFNTDGHYRAISLTAPGRSNVRIRARKGYYAPQQKR